MIPECVVIPAGTGIFGGGTEDKFADSTEFPSHSIEIPHPFLMATVPVTVGLWNKWKSLPGNPDLPVTGVSWFEAVEFCAFLTAESGCTWRLPREREWEYACRAGTSTPFSTGENIVCSQANFLYAEDGRRVGAGRVLPAGSFPPNPFGLHDMHGNVLEWTADPWRPSHDSDFSGDPEKRVVRGGGWDYLPRLLRSSWRDGLPAGSRQDNLGFRIVSDQTGHTNRR